MVPKNHSLEKKEEEKEGGRGRVGRGNGTRAKVSQNRERTIGTNGPSSSTAPGERDERGLGKFHLGGGGLIRKSPVEGARTGTGQVGSVTLLNQRKESLSPWLVPEGEEKSRLDGQPCFFTKSI